VVCQRSGWKFVFRSRTDSSNCSILSLYRALCSIHFSIFVLGIHRVFGPMDNLLLVWLSFLRTFVDHTSITVQSSCFHIGIAHLFLLHYCLKMNSAKNYCILMCAEPVLLLTFVLDKMLTRWEFSQNPKQHHHNVYAVIIVHEFRNMWESACFFEEYDFVAWIPCSSPKDERTCFSMETVDCISFWATPILTTLKKHFVDDSFRPTIDHNMTSLSTVVRWYFYGRDKSFGKLDIVIGKLAQSGDHRAVCEWIS
jgi:hypothetical protein